MSPLCPEEEALLHALEVAPLDSPNHQSIKPLHLSPSRKKGRAHFIMPAAAAFSPYVPVT